VRKLVSSRRWPDRAGRPKRDDARHSGDAMQFVDFTAFADGRSGHQRQRAIVEMACAQCPLFCAMNR
jgi:ABC-type enterochelin transport system ATPase subunit